MNHLCFNQLCSKEWRQFGSGHLYAMESRSLNGTPQKTEYLWLCPACAAQFVIALDAAGRASIQAKNAEGQTQWEHPRRSLRLMMHADRNRLPLMRGPRQAHGEKRALLSHDHHDHHDHDDHARATNGRPHDEAQLTGMTRTLGRRLTALNLRRPNAGRPAP